MSCGQIISRVEMDGILTKLNPNVSKDENFEFTPDGDAEISVYDGFLIPDCAGCGGILKPDVVFFGEQVPSGVAELAMQKLDAADALLVAGTSLSVNSGLRFVKRANRASKPVIIVNLGATKGDHLALAKIEANTSLALDRLLND
jgi:NAD-dependent SIR2 family protein deacetylase